LDTSLIKIVVMVERTQGDGGQTMVELEVYENSRYDELATNALRKLGMVVSEHNLRLMTH
jgi:hypothetical protein